jgi:Raf kinase inhibitor-like YbhB/YbcL family protein
MTSRRCGARSALQFSLCAGFLFSLGATQISCSSAVTQQQVPTLELKSSSFSGDTILDAYSSCDGQRNISPQLSWSAPPKGTQSFALVVIDRDSPLGWNFVHWVLYDVPADKRELPEAIAKQEQLRDGSRQGRNGYDKTGYVGPCPPGHSPHHYVLTLFALDTRLNLPDGVTKKQVMKAIKGHVLASGQLISKFQH